MANPFKRASAQLAAIGQSILRPNQNDDLNHGPFQAFSGDSERGSEITQELLNIATISQGDTTGPLAFSITGTLQPRIQLNSTPDSSVQLKLVWGEPLPAESYLTRDGNRLSIAPTEPLQAGLYELTVGAMIVHFILYDAASPQVPLQIEPLADIATHQPHITRSPDLIGVVFVREPTDIEISGLCRNVPIKPVSYSKHFRLLMGQKLSLPTDSFAMLEQLRQSPLVQKAFIPGESTLQGGDRPGITVAVAIESPDFQIPAVPPNDPPLVA